MLKGFDLHRRTASHRSAATADRVRRLCPPTVPVDAMLRVSHDKLTSGRRWRLTVEQPDLSRTALPPDAAIRLNVPPGDTAGSELPIRVIAAR